MTSYLNKFLKQTFVYWAFSARDGFGGATFVAPVEINGRREHKSKMFTDSSGQRFESSHVTYLGQDVAENDWLFLGELTDIASAIDETNPKNVTGALEVKAFSKIPTLRADKFQRVAFHTSATSLR